MTVRLALLLSGMAAFAAWLVQPVEAQQDSEPIPEELRIIEDLPEALEDGRRVLGRGDDPVGEADVLTGGPVEQGRTVLEGERETLFGDDQSLLSAPPEDSPAERLLPDEDDVPDMEVDPTSPDRDDRLPRDAGRVGTADDRQDRITGPDDTIPQPRDPGGIGAGPAGGRTGGGSGSLF